MDFSDSKVENLTLRKGKVQQDFFHRIHRGLSLVLTVGAKSMTSFLPS